MVPCIWRGAANRPDPTRSPIRGNSIPGTVQQFLFSDHRWDVEPSAYAQDQIHLGDWNSSVGARFDHYGFAVREGGLEPKSRRFALLLLAEVIDTPAYDRVSQTPPVEDLLLASSPQIDSLNALVVRLPVEPARANYHEAGSTKSFFGTLKVDAKVFHRDFRNYSDDDVLLDTGVSFPIAFAKAQITGEELRIKVPH